MEQIFINGEFYSKDEAKVSVFDHGFLFGDGIFETIRAYNGVCFQLQEHLERLYQGAEFLRINVSYEKEQVTFWVSEAIKKNNLIDAYIRITLTRGTGKPGIDPRTCPEPTLIITALPLAPYYQDIYRKGWEAIILNIVRNSPNALPPTIKSMNFLNNILAKLELIDREKSEGFFLNHDGYVTEGVVSNLFIVIQGKIFTPSVESGILPGITRKVVIKLCQKLNIQLVEKKLLPEELFQADECFITNSLAEILPIYQVDERVIGSGEPGRITKLLHEHYIELVNQQTENATTQHS